MEQPKDPTYALINRVQLQSEVADLLMHYAYMDTYKEMLIEDEDGTHYTDEGQDIFNEYYDDISVIVDEAMEE